MSRVVPTRSRLRASFAVHPRLSGRWSWQHRAGSRRERPRILVAAMMAIVLASASIPPAVLAAPEDEVRVVARGSIQTAGPSGSDTFDVAATDDGDGGISGWMAVMVGGVQVSGQVTCLVTSGTTAVVGGSGIYWDGFDYVARYVTVFLTDVSPDGTLDTAAIAAPTDIGPADCAAPSPPQEPLWYGQVTLLEGPSDTGVVSGQGTTPYGLSSTRSFEFSGERTSDGTVTGTYSISEPGGFFSTSGTIVCLDIRGSHAMIIGRGTDPSGGGGGGGGGGPTDLYATFFVDDLGPNGTGDLIAFGTFSSMAPAECLAAQDQPGEPLITGYLDVNGSGGGVTPPEAATIVATGAIQTGEFQADTFDVAAISDGSGGVTGQIRMSRSGTSVSGAVTCLAVDDDAIVVGGQGTMGGGGLPGDPPMIVWFTLYLTDNGPDGTGDTAALDGPTNMAPPDCASASPPQQPLWYGQVTVLGNPSDSGVVAADGTHDMGSGFVRTFDIDAVRDPSGAVGGTFSISESGGFSLTGQIDCLYIDGERAMLIGHGPYDIGGGGSGSLHAAIFVEDGGPDGSSDLISLNAYRSESPFACLAAQEYPGTTLLSGDIEVGAGVTPTPSPTTAPTPTPTPEPTPEPSTEPTPTPTVAPTPTPTTTPPPDPLTLDTGDPGPASVPRLGRFEDAFTLSRTWPSDQVHDPDLIEVSATFTAPSGATFDVPAWFGTDLTLRAGTGIGGSELYDPVPGTEAGVWHVRFSPDELGTYTYTLRAEDKVTGGGQIATSAPMNFEATPSAAKGQVERDPRDDRFLRHADGTPYLPMGHNVAFGDGIPFNDGSHYFEPHFASMQQAGQNWTRVWMTDFYITSLEWAATHWSNQYSGVGRYADVPAYRIEQVLDLAETYGLEVQLVLNDHGQFSDWVNARWWDNPYSTANGGPVPAADPAAFFSDPTARELFKQRLRYLVARYGAYRDLLAWELFNEIQFIGSPARNPYNSAEVRDDVVAWHAEMAAYLRTIDPYDHLITTSSDIESSMAAIWGDPNIDLVQVHDYGDHPGRDERFAGYVEDLHDAYGKPVIIGEFGLTDAPEIHFDPVGSGLPADLVAHLSQATHLHNSAWASAMSGSGAMSWWWGNYIHDDATRNRVAPDFPANERINPPLRAFFAGEDLAAMGLDEAAISHDADVVALGMDNGSEAFVWVRDALNTYASGVGPGDLAGRTIAGEVIELAGFSDATYRVEIHDPWGEDPVDASRLAIANAGVLTVALPGFQRDIALKIRPAGAATADQATTVDVTSPNPGPITVTRAITTDPPPVGSGYTFLDAQLDITAPAASAADPLTLVFTIDAALLASVDPDLTADTLTVFRDGVPVEDCTTDTGDDPATPDPCVSDRMTLSGGDDEGDARITVLTSQASTWNVGSLPSASVPGAPTGVSAVRGDAQAGVSWTAPTDDGGAAITAYTVTSSPGGLTAGVDGTTTSTVVTGLTNGVAYTFTVTATNIAGTGPASAPSNVVTPGPRMAQSITFTNPGAKTMLQTPFTATATASSGLPVTLGSTTPVVCTVAGFVVTLHAAGSCSLTATQAGDLTYLPANPVTRTFTVSQATQSITFTNPGAKTLLQTPFTATATASSGLPVTLTSTTTTVCTVDGFDVTLLAAGSCSITATQPGDVVYRAANPVTRAFTVSKATQSITFTNPGAKTLLQTPFTVTATASSGLPVTLTSTTTTVCTVDGFDVTLLAAGSCSLTASQPGDAVYQAATSITRTFTVSQVAQTITFPRPPNSSILASPLAVTATASSGLPVTLTSTTPATCSVTGFDVALIAAGTCTIRATQPGDVVYRPATAVSRSFTITKAPQTITIADPGPQSMLVPTVVITAWASSNLPVTLASTTTGVCTISGDVVTLRRAGTCRIRGTQPGDATYAAAPAVVRAFTVSAGTALPFVVASGTGLTAGGTAFRIHGASIYHTSNPGAPNDPARIVALATEGGLNSLRLVNMFVEDGTDPGAPFAEADWQRVDRLLARARGAGMRVVLDLSAFRNHLVRRDIDANGWGDDCAPGADRSSVDYADVDPYRADLAGEWEDFLDFVIGRINTVNGVRYGDDATIAVISIAGEPLPPASEECGKAATTAGLTDFYDRTLSYLASIDPNHLRSSGGFIHLDWEELYGGASGIDGAAIFALPDHTLPSLHTYPAHYELDGTPIDHQAPKFAALGTLHDKPWFTEEFGWPQSVGDATRAARFAAIYAEQAPQGSSGAMFWNLGIEEAGGSHDVHPATPQTWSVIQVQ